MHDEVSRKSPGPAHFIGSAVAALMFLILVSLTLPFLQSPPPPDKAQPTSPRKRVVVFIIDTTDYFDSHGDYVHSVIRRHCLDCEVTPVNLHGDISIPNIIKSLQHIHVAQKQFDTNTTTLVNISLGTYSDDPVLRALILTLDAAGVVLIASAGNDDTSRPFYPAAIDEVLAICSTTHYSKTKTTYSNFGPWVDLCAPGLQYVTRPLQHGGIASGTSFASPIVTGTLGQLLLDAPCSSIRAGIRAMRRTAEPIAGNRRTLGAGVLQPHAAAHYLRTLYDCKPVVGVIERYVRQMRRLGENVLVTIGLIIYALVSIFAVPFLFAYVAEGVQHKAQQRQQRRVLLAYMGTPNYRQERLQVLRVRCQQTGKLRQRHYNEFFALLNALHLYRETCSRCHQLASEIPDHRTTTDMRDTCSCYGSILEKSASIT